MHSRACDRIAVVCSPSSPSSAAARAAQFQTAWFLVSLITELMVVVVLRTRRLPWRSRPSRLLLITTFIVTLLSLALPYSGPPARLFGIRAPSASELAALLAIVAGYVAATEALKHWFYKHLDWSGRARAPHRPTLGPIAS